MTNQPLEVVADALLPCPKCGCPNGLELDSSSAAEASWIECHNCQHRMQEACDEETLAERWNKLNRNDMPSFTPPTDTPARVVPAQEASLRRSLTYWHGRAKAAEATLATLPTQAVISAVIDWQPLTHLSKGDRLWQILENAGLPADDQRAALARVVAGVG